MILKHVDFTKIFVCNLLLREVITQNNSEDKEKMLTIICIEWTSVVPKLKQHEKKSKLTIVGLNF